jgi:hypothetical protein
MKNTRHSSAISATEQTQDAPRYADAAIGTDDIASPDSSRAESRAERRRFERSLPMPAERHE